MHYLGRPRLLVVILAVSVTVSVAVSAALSSVARAAEPAPENAPGNATDEQWGLRVQSTAVTQMQNGVPGRYRGPNSFAGDEETRTSFTATLYAGARLWKGAEFYLDPEVSAGSGLNSTRGAAGFPNGEIYRVDTPDPKLFLGRVYFRQDFALGEETEAVESDKNQLSRAARPERRLTATFGKFSLNDWFDGNAYAHDPRTQFLNWSMMDNLAWDYAADTRGYTWGAAFEWNERAFAARAALVLVGSEPNGTAYDFNLAQAKSENVELEWRYALAGGRKGAARAMGFANQARMGRYDDAVRAATGGATPDLGPTRDYRTKYGFGLNVEQEVANGVGVFARAGWNDGATETWAFTEADRAFSVGTSISGRLWSREKDVVGAALAANEISEAHAEFLERGGTGFIVGDGALSHAPEEIFETYYAWQTTEALQLAADWQLIRNPGFNADRGPALIWALRAHAEF